MLVSVPAATGCGTIREHSLQGRVFCFEIMNFEMLSSAQKMHKQTGREGCREREKGEWKEGGGETGDTTSSGQQSSCKAKFSE